MILLRHGETVFNVLYGKTRRDPGIRDPRLTERGREQAETAARTLAGQSIGRVIASPYTRAIQTADVIARARDVPLVIDETIRERFAFSCDIGTSRSVLAERWSAYAFDHIDDVWWPAREEPIEQFDVRCEVFRRRMAQTGEWQGAAVASTMESTALFREAQTLTPAPISSLLYSGPQPITQPDWVTAPRCQT